MTARVRMGWRVALLVAATAAGCATSTAPPDTGLEGLALASVQPAVVLPASKIDLTGDSFVPPEWGSSSLRLRGTIDGRAVDAAVPADFVDYDHMQLFVDEAFIAAFGTGDFTGEATVEAVSAVDGKTYASPPLPLTLAIRDQLTPRLDTLQSGGLIFVNDPIQVEGEGFLLGSGEGVTFAVVEGCIAPTGGGGCAPVGPVEVPVTPASVYDRQRGSFAFEPRIGGIGPGVFTGTVFLRNRHGAVSADEPPVDGSEVLDASYERIAPAIFSVSTKSASLGQFVDVRGGGFVGPGGGDDDAVTLLHMIGSFTPTGQGGDVPSGVPVDLLLVPAFRSGQLVRYVVSEEDALGSLLDLRRDTGSFSGTVAPETRYGSEAVSGDPASMTLALAPVKQVIWLDFRPSYVESLRHYGLRAADSLIRARVKEVLARAYATVNLEVRTEEPTDFALYSTVEIHGPDPNGMGLFGYDNSPGKDTDNLRLYDRLGGVNAATQEDGFAGYGGVFIDSLIGFSQHPGELGSSIPGADPAFDQIFDPFRDDAGGTPLSAADFSAGVPQLASGDSCPAAGAGRNEQAACAVWVMGSLIGGTVAHEVGHSLGLANPYGEGFHDPGDVPDRLMDGGGERSFLERAELAGQGPAVFCDEEYVYLRQILPTGEPDDATSRPPCQ